MTMLTSPVNGPFSSFSMWACSGRMETVTGPEKPSRMRTGSVNLSMMRTCPFSAWPSTKPETPMKFATKVLAGRV